MPMRPDGAVSTLTRYTGYVQLEIINSVRQGVVETMKYYSSYKQHLGYTHLHKCASGVRLASAYLMWQASVLVQPRFLAGTDSSHRRKWPRPAEVFDRRCVMAHPYSA
ncbi:hypothetical protein CDAR_544221 [Caerostris darwini]|uniref:Uncharacterized protein n=1 Tax=Caerostris darwini TaxID=1538125 RepID=A0AAV4THJ5_9ARAC|nr:hypothetical protein CDAR_544221 [Caerostris darwini]